MVQILYSNQQDNWRSLFPKRKCGTNQNTLILGTDASNTDRTYVELRYNNVERIRTTVDGSRLAGIVNLDGTTQSTKTNGTVVIDGGVGIAKHLMLVKMLLHTLLQMRDMI